VPAEKDTVIREITQAKIDILNAIEAKRAQEAIGMDSMVRRTENIDRTVNWLKRQWEKFSRPGDTKP
jgi:hypothetical protein